MVAIVDISTQSGSRASALRAAGVRTVIRYCDTIRPAKRLSRDEAVAFVAAGLKLGVVHEARRGDFADSFEHASGVADAHHARTYGTSVIGQPSGSLIYFAVDFDATAAEVRNLVVPYFRGVGDAFSEPTGEQNYVVGVCFDNDPTPAGADHVYLVIEALGREEMSVADNQRTTETTHRRFAGGAGGKTPTDYFLRAA